ncbi:MAG TPA: acyl-CoA dehydrogenase family protein [Gemmatimonadaceae bacterium]|nr:acyl-CoA dehydrogenase family protein [Gemmatimonadaceae bacterium]
MSTMLEREARGAVVDVDRLLDRVHEIGRDVIQPAASSVDSCARFPQEGIDALRELKLLSAYVPEEFGGMGLSVIDIGRICEALGQYCGSTAMVFAMHQIQAACIVHHGQQSPYFEQYLRDLVDEQWLIASATTELGVGGDLRSSICALEAEADGFRLTKKAPVISYGEHADQILVTCRRAPDAPASDQVHVMIWKEDYSLEPISSWDTLGFRGTCSSGFVVTATGKTEQVLPAPFADILSQTMHPFSHIVWASLWLGIASDAVNRARAYVRGEARKNPQMPPTSSLRLAEVDIVLHGMRNNVTTAVNDYHRLLAGNDSEAFRNFGFAIRTNNLKLSSSQLIVDIVGRAMLICGINGYRNDSKYALGRHLRDAYGAALMVNNDRIANHNATMLLALREA